MINISATSPNHINAMDMEQGYGDGENPVVLKSEFLLSLCEQLMGDRLLSAKEKSIIDRCTAQCYHDRSVPKAERPVRSHPLKRWLKRPSVQIRKRLDARPAKL